MSNEKYDYLEKCNQTNMPAVRHMKLKCKVCRKPDCKRAGAKATSK